MTASTTSAFCTDVRDRALCEILNEELVCALGCTEPIAVAYAAALARMTLGTEPEALEVGCSGNIIKNVKSVTVPNSDGMHGIEAAATLGAVGGNPDSALEVLESVVPEDIAHARELLGRVGYCSVELVEGVPNLYIKVRARAAGHVAEVVIAEHHTNVVYRALDDEALEGSRDNDPASIEQQENPAYAYLTIDAIVGFAESGDIEAARAALERQIELNDAISREGLQNTWGAEVGRTLMETRGEGVACRARARAAAGSDARMSAAPCRLSSTAGRVTRASPAAFRGRLCGGTGRGSREARARARAVRFGCSTCEGLHRCAFGVCGVVCAACGAGAAITWMRGGTREQIDETIVNTLGNVGGIVCDGAKPSCAAKISAAVDAAILASDMALAGRGFQAGEGLVKETVEKTIASMGYVGRVGMKPTDVEILNIMIGKTRV